MLLSILLIFTNISGQITSKNDYTSLHIFNPQQFGTGTKYAGAGYNYGQYGRYLLYKQILSMRQVNFGNDIYGSWLLTNMLQI